MKGYLALKIVAFTLLATAIHIAKCNESYEKWETFDKDKSGDISLQEFKETLSQENVQFTDAEVQKIFDDVDINGDKKITKTEFYSKALPAIRFKKMDTDNSGSLTKTELEAGLKKYFPNIKPDMVNTLFTQADVDNDGKITNEEFFYRISPYFRFNVFDKNENGKITKEELKEGLNGTGRSLTDDQVEKIFKLGDKDNSGELTYNEYRLGADPYNVFMKFDKNRSGTIDKAEFKKGLQNYGFEFSDADIDKYWAIADVNKDGNVDYEEFLTKVYPLFYFRKFDASKDGKITQAEFTEGLKLVGSSQSKANLFTTADASGDGTIDYEEFLTVIEKIRE